jgi:nicotinamide phosphoribosyltransferase
VIVINIQSIVLLDEKFGHTLNDKGFKVLNNVKLVQGDGVTEEIIFQILECFEQKGYSADNILFGMGGALLQKLDRDTQKFAMKCSAVKIDGVWHDVQKDPITDKGKRSKKGRLKLIENFGKFKTVGKTLEVPFMSDCLSIVYYYGRYDEVPDTPEVNFETVRNVSKTY